MVLDLKAQKLMHGGNGVGVFRCDADTCAALGVFEFVLNRLAEPLHGLRARGILGVDEHRSGKITGCEHFCDVAEVHANSIPRRDVAGHVGLDIDGPAIGREKEVMCGFVVGEAHDVIAAPDDALMMVVSGGRFVLGGNVQGCKDQECCG